MAASGNSARDVWLQKQASESNAQADAVSAKMAQDGVADTLRTILSDGVQASVKGALNQQATTATANTRDYKAWPSSLSKEDRQDLLIWLSIETLGPRSKFPRMRLTAREIAPRLNSQSKRGIRPFAY